MKGNIQASQSTIDSGACGRSFCLSEKTDAVELCIGPAD